MIPAKEKKGSRKKPKKEKKGSRKKGKKDKKGCSCSSIDFSSEGEEGVLEKAKGEGPQLQWCIWRSQRNIWSPRHLESAAFGVRKEKRGGGSNHWRDCRRWAAMSGGYEEMESLRCVMWCENRKNKKLKMFNMCSEKNRNNVVFLVH